MRPSTAISKARYSIPDDFDAEPKPRDFHRAYLITTSGLREVFFRHKARIRHPLDLSFIRLRDPNWRYYARLGAERAGGLKWENLERFLAKGGSLVASINNGQNAAELREYLQSRGFDSILIADPTGQDRTVPVLLNTSQLVRYSRYDRLRYEYDQNEPRVPKGNEEGGQWTKEGGSSAAQFAKGGLVQPTRRERTALGDLVDNSELSEGADEALGELKSKGYEAWIPDLKEKIVVIDEGKGAYKVLEGGDLKDAHEWVWDQANFNRIGQYQDQPDFSKDFWDGVPKRGTVLWHGTTDEAFEGIKKNGLGTRDKTRGIGNRSIGAAVFTSSDREVAESGGYDHLIGIDVSAMKRDGYTPPVEQEPPVAEYDQVMALAHAIGLEDFEADLESGMDPGTVIIRGDVPRKYLIFDGGTQRYSKRYDRIRYEVRHAPAGGVSIGGEQFAGGEFIPSEVMEKATPEERAAVEGQAPADTGNRISARPEDLEGMAEQMRFLVEEQNRNDTVWYKVAQEEIRKFEKTGEVTNRLSAVMLSLGGNSIPQVFGKQERQAAGIISRVAKAQLLTLLDDGIRGMMSGREYSAWRQDAPTKKYVQQKAKLYEQTMGRVLDRMTPTALNRLVRSVRKFDFYPNISSLSEKARSINPNIAPNQESAGFFYAFNREVHLNGSAEWPGEARERGLIENTYAHELSHALDWDGADVEREVYTAMKTGVAPKTTIKDWMSHYQFSGSPEWEDAWEHEIYSSRMVRDDKNRLVAEPPLSDYARQDVREGFAEFGRLVVNDPARAEREFPKSWALWKQWGLV